MSYMPFATNNLQRILDDPNGARCVYCLGSPTVDETTETCNNSTVICPNCGIDAVVPTSSIPGIPEETLRIWHRDGFGVSCDESSSDEYSYDSETEYDDFTTFQDQVHLAFLYNDVVGNQEQCETKEAHPTPVVNFDRHIEKLNSHAIKSECLWNGKCKHLRLMFSRITSILENKELSEEDRSLTFALKWVCRQRQKFLSRRTEDGKSKSHLQVDVNATLDRIEHML